jgi:hypothetical protein
MSRGEAFLRTVEIGGAKDSSQPSYDLFDLLYRHHLTGLRVGLCRVAM